MPASCGAQTVTRTVQDLALPSLPSKNIARGPPSKLAPTPGAFTASLAPQQGKPRVSCARLRLLSPPHGGEVASHRLLSLSRGRSRSQRQEGRRGCHPGQKSCLLCAGPRS